MANRATAQRDLPGRAAGCIEADNSEPRTQTIAAGRSRQQLTSNAAQQTHMPGPADSIPNYYELMGVAETASADEIKRAYRKLARKFHPDVSKEADATERFKQLGEAYEVLKDPEKRATFDDIRRNPQPSARQFRRAPGAPGFGAGTGDQQGFSEFFTHMFGQGMDDDGASPFDHTSRRTSARGADVHARLALTLEEAFSGTEQSVSLRNAQNGSTKTLKVRIPAGVTQSQVIRLKEQGAPGAPPGHLYIEIDVAPHPLFILDGRDILLKVPLAPWEAALGHRIRVPTLAGSVDVNVPAGQKSGARMRLKGRGMPAQGDLGVGDQYLVFRIEAPVPQDDEERALYAALAKISRPSLRADLEAWRNTGVST